MLLVFFSLCGNPEPCMVASQRPRGFPLWPEAYAATARGSSPGAQVPACGACCGTGVLAVGAGSPDSGRAARRGLVLWTWLDLHGQSTTGKICTPCRGGGGGKNKGATGWPGAEAGFRGGRTKEFALEERGRAGNREWSALRLAEAPAWIPQSRASDKICPSEDPSLASPFCLLLLLNGDGGHALPKATFLGKGGQMGSLLSISRGKNSHQPVSFGPGALAPISQKLTIEAPTKQPLPPPLLQRSGDPRALGDTRHWGATGLEPPSSLHPRKGWRGHGCKVLGFFSLLDMNKGIRTASFRRSLRRTKGPAV